ncbi:MAG: hypothetical protein PHY45_06195 [Rhodocyclaceae bacterium]|nr:hypothetical protein [Rhodocyclaceae bacterium]
MNLERYVGRIVRLKQDVFQPVIRRAQRQGIALENCFIVAAVSREMRKLICYGADFRVAVDAREVVLV